MMLLTFFLRDSNLKSELGGLLGINDTWLRFRNEEEIESQDELDQMNHGLGVEFLYLEGMLKR